MTTSEKPKTRGNDRISRVFHNAPRLSVDDSSKIVIISDCHRGTGDQNDNFAGNENIYFAAMTRYFNLGYTYIELGDGDELWENRNFKFIKNENSHIFWLLSKFRRADRLYMIYGNHDIVKKKRKWRSKNLSTYYDERSKRDLPLFGDMEVTEGIVLNHRETGRKLYLTHGHQADFLNDRLWRLARFLVLYLWRSFELVGIKNPADTAKNRAKRHKTEQRLSRWAERQGEILIAGHTHHPVFPKRGEPLYFNDGSCVHPRCITALEITDGALSLVKWAVESRGDGTLYICKTVLEGPMRL